MGAGDFELFWNLCGRTGRSASEERNLDPAGAEILDIVCRSWLEELWCVSVPDWSHVGTIACLREPQVGKRSARDLEVHSKILDSLHILTACFKKENTRLSMLHRRAATVP